MSRTLRAPLLLLLWVAGLVAASAFAARQLSVSSDLRLFLPSPATAEERMILDAVGEGAAARLLVVALEGAPADELADASRALAAALRRDAAFLFVANGEQALELIPDSLLPYRYLLSPTLDTRRLDRTFLAEALAARARDIASPAGIFLEPWLARDPTLELVNVLRSFEPTREPRKEFDVWFDTDGRRALLLAETRAPAFDPAAQREALEALEAALAAVAGDAVRMLVSGAGRFSVLMEERARAEVRRLGTAATVGIVVLLLIAYRSIGAVVSSMLPLASAGLAGIAAVGAVFGSVHGITLAFGFTLIGVAQDYPLHLLSHRRVGRAPRVVARELWPALATGVAGTCIAYLTFFFAGVVGLSQLACFTVMGLAVAGLATRFLLPALLDEPRRDSGESPVLARVWSLLAGLPRPRWAAGVLCIVCVAVVALAPQPLWNDDLQGLTPVPQDLLAADRELRAELGAADLRYLLAVQASSEEAVLERLETLGPMLEALVDRGTIQGFDHGARYLPSAVTQRRRQAALAEPESLRAAVEAAAADTVFRAGAFDGFVEDVAAARALPPLTIGQLRAAGLSGRLEMLLMETDEGGRVGLVTLTGVADPQALRDVAASTGATFVDLRQASESLVARQRDRILVSLAVAAVLLVGVVAIGLRDRRRIVRVLVPMAVTTFVVVAVLQAAGVSLTLFHLVSLILAAGLGLDYALFFAHAADDPAAQRRALHAILACALSTLLVFALLATSSLPVLRAIGLPVTIGVVSNFLLAMLVTARRTA